MPLLSWPGASFVSQCPGFTLGPQPEHSQKLVLRTSAALPTPPHQKSRRLATPTQATNVDSVPPRPQSGSIERGAHAPSGRSATRDRGLAGGSVSYTHLRAHETLMNL
eukprot:261927-Prymnesium_polylepis.2